MGETIEVDLEKLDGKPGYIPTCTCWMKFSRGSVVLITDAEGAVVVACHFCDTPYNYSTRWLGVGKFETMGG